MDEHIGPKRSALRMTLGAAVVLVGVAAVLVALTIVLDHYPVVEGTAARASEDRSAAVVGVMTPVLAAIAGVVGLYFGISATGSARGQQAQQAQATAEAAHAIADAAKSASEAAAAQSASLAGGTRMPPVTVPNAPTVP